MGFSWQRHGSTPWFNAAGELLPFSKDSELWEIDGLHFSRLGSRTLGRRLAQQIQADPAAHALLGADKTLGVFVGRMGRMGRMSKKCWEEWGNRVFEDIKRYSMNIIRSNGKNVGKYGEEDVKPPALGCETVAFSASAEPGWYESRRWRDDELEDHWQLGKPNALVHRNSMALW